MYCFLESVEQHFVLNLAHFPHFKVQPELQIRAVGDFSEVVELVVRYFLVNSSVKLVVGVHLQSLYDLLEALFRGELAFKLLECFCVQEGKTVLHPFSWVGEIVFELFLGKGQGIA